MPQQNIAHVVRTRAPGSTGTELWGGYLSEEDFTPPKLQGTSTRMSTFKQMLTDAYVNAAFLAITLPIRGADVSVEPASDDPQHQLHAKFIQDTIIDSELFDWEDTLRQALLHLVYGFYPFVKKWKILKDDPLVSEYRTGNRYLWVLEKLEARLPETIAEFHRDPETGNLSHVVQRAMMLSGRYDEATIGAEHLVWFVNNQEGDNYRGESVVRPAYGSWWRRSILLKIEAIKHERFGTPVPVVKLGENYTEDDFQAAIDVGEAYRSHEKAFVIELPNGEVRFLDVGHQAGTDIRKAIESENHEILTSTLSQWLNLGNTETGSRAVGETMSDFMFAAIRFYALNVAKTFKRSVIKDAIAVNFGPQSRYPSLKFSKIQRPNANAIITAIPNLITSGTVTAGDDVENHVRDILDMPEKEAEEVAATRKRSQVFFAENGKTYWRKLTPLEKQINLQEKDASLDDATKQAIKLGEDYQNEAVKIMIQKAIALLAQNPDDKTFEEKLAKIVAPMQRKFEADMFAVLRGVFEQGEADVDEEIEKLRKEGARFAAPAEPVSQAKKTVKRKSILNRARWAVQSLTGLLKGVFDKEVRKQRERGAIDSPTLKDRLLKLVGATFKREARENVNQAYGLGRSEGARKNQKVIEKVVRSEVMDENICEECIPLDGIEFEVGSAMWDLLGNGPNPNCLGGDQCRGVNIFVTRFEEEE